MKKDFTEFEKKKFEQYVDAVAGIADAMQDSDYHPLSAALKVAADQLTDIVERFEEQARETGGAA